MAEFGGRQQVDENTPRIISGLMAIGPSKRKNALNSKWLECLVSLLELVDYVVVRMDSRLTRSQQERINEIVKNRGEVFVGDPIEKISLGDWRNEMLRKLDDIGPDLVLTPDCDEMFGPGIENDLRLLWRSDSCGLMFDYSMSPPRDPVYPKKPHMKVFKWQENLAYKDPVFCIPNFYRCDRKHTKLKAKSPMIHYAFVDEDITGLRSDSSRAGLVTLSVSIDGQSVAECLRELGKAIGKFGR